MKFIVINFLIRFVSRSIRVFFNSFGISTIEKIE